MKFQLEMEAARALEATDRSHQAELESFKTRVYQLESSLRSY